MIRTTLERFESLRVMRCEGNLVIKGKPRGNAIITSGPEPRLRREAGVVELMFGADGEIELPPAVALEVLDCAGNLVIEDFAGPLVLGRVRGTLRANRIASLAVRGEIDGNLTVEGARAVEAGQVNGSARVSDVLSVHAARISGDLECRSVETDVSVDDVAGKLRVAGAGAGVRAGRVTGKCEIFDAGAIDLEMVMGKLKAGQIAGALKAGHVGGRLSADQVGGNVSAGFVAGHVTLDRVGGEVELPEVGGAVDLSGPLPSAGRWTVRSRGRISVELPRDAALEISAHARWGRVRLHGVSSEGLRRDGRSRVEGRLGAGGGPSLSLEATDSDIVLFGEHVEAREYDCRRGRRFRRRFGAPFEALAEDLREDLPGFVNEVVGAAGRIVSESGKFTGTVAQEVGRSVGDAMREVERSLSELESKVPRDVGDKLSRLGRKIGDVVERAVDETRERRRSSPAQTRADSGEAKAREAPARETAAEAAGVPDASDASDASGASDAKAHDRALLEILKAVREGDLAPEDAEALINSLAERRRASGPADATR